MTDVARPMAPLLDDEYGGWRTARDAYVFTFTHFGSALRLVAGWAILSLLSAQGILPLVVWLVTDFEFAANVVSDMNEGVLSLVLSVPAFLCFLLGYPSMAVAWHRFVLQGTRPPLLAIPSVSSWLYLACIFAYAITVYLIPAALIGGLAYLGGLGATAFAFLAIPLVLFLLGVTLRFSLVLPAIAIRDRATGLKISWRATDGHIGSILWGFIVAVWPFATLERACRKLNESEHIEVDSLAAFLLDLGSIVGALMTLLLLATFLSLSYRSLLKPAAPPSDQPQAASSAA